MHNELCKSEPQISTKNTQLFSKITYVTHHILFNMLNKTVIMIYCIFTIFQAKQVSRQIIIIMYLHDSFL